MLAGMQLVLKGLFKIFVKELNHAPHQRSQYKSHVKSHFRGIVRSFRFSLLWRWRWFNNVTYRCAHDFTFIKPIIRKFCTESNCHPYRVTVFNRIWRHRVPKLVFDR